MYNILPLVDKNETKKRLEIIWVISLTCSLQLNVHALLQKAPWQDLMNMRGFPFNHAL